MAHVNANVSKTKAKRSLWKKLLEAVGEDTKKAEITLLLQTSKSPILEEVAHAHIEHLVNAREYTIKRRKGHNRIDFEGLGHVPVDQFTEDDMRLIGPLTGGVLFAFWSALWDTPSPPPESKVCSNEKLLQAYTF
ncbi:hypothetical protein ACT3UD_15325 [Glutamicibacter sp. 287]|uniref:hypothetical protein n=1 Tax=unclassified Glutamicibacter TaxID=2627139 RepID=UPI000BB79773|nr:hypothetical protein [Glutamicibacter sp. BW80]PCC28732.1 hypothetical protein CIK76_08360 [Glutamicibacter sp. BW80]